MDSTTNFQYNQNAKNQEIIELLGKLEATQKQIIENQEKVFGKLMILRKELDNIRENIQHNSIIADY